MFARVLNIENFSYNIDGSINTDLEKTIKELETLFRRVKLTQNSKKLFDNPKSVKGLRLGFICPGAIKTIDFLNKNVKSQSSKDLTKKIKRYTDALFFVEIIVIYKKYINKQLFNDAILIIGDPCSLSNKITEKISNYFSKLPNYLNKNLPDDFYHIRHDTLICSKNKNLAKKRINMLKSFYRENFTTQNCLGARDGVSGCRDCCKKNYKDTYQKCVSDCMDY